MDRDPTVAACQLRVEDLDVATNLDRVTDRLASLDCDVVLFPELGLTGFVADDRVYDAALHTDGPELDRLRNLATDTGTAMVVGFAEDAGDAYYNTVAYLTAEGDITTYRKRHLWGGETQVFDPGDELVVVQTPAGTTGLVTCYDLNFVADSASFLDRAVDALFVVGAWPASHAPNWKLLVRARALDGVRWAVACGRTGRRDLVGSDPTTYAGRSLVARPDGVVAAELAYEPDTLVHTLDSGVLARQRELVGVSVERGDDQ